MHELDSFNKKLRRLVTRTLVVAALACAIGVPVARAQHEQHTQHDRHTTPQPTPTPSPVETSPPAATRQPTQDAAPTKDNTKDAPAPTHDHHNHPSPTTPATVSPSNVSPTAGNAPSTTATPNATPAPAAWGDTLKANKPDAANHAAHGAPAHEAASGDAGLMVMSGGDEMGIRVGASANVMSMGQMGSGTSWQPATTPMYMWHKRAGEWLLMLHGEAKIGVNRQGGLRGVTKFESQNWLMPMAYRRVGRGTLQLRGMFSLEPLTFSGAGSPQLFQTGEVYKGQSIIDAQHPHDLFMELSAQYTMPLGERGTWYAYVGFPGEPALGPVAFMHRASSSENPTAPLAHHFQDSTHIAFGVLTTGFTYRWLKLEGSLFNGREPDDRRYNFEFNPWNSRSVRISVAPDSNWTMQFSYGLLKNPELLEPGDTRRMTASVHHNQPFTRGNVATSLIWGRNREEHGGETFKLNGYTAETTVNFLERNYIYTRLELVDRKEILRHEELDRLGFDHDSHPQFRIGAYTFGAARDIWTTGKLSVALGGDVTFYSKPAVLDAIYGRNPTSYKFFFRIRPSRMSGHDQHASGGHGEH